MFESVSGKVDFPSLEKGVLEFWDERGVFQRSVDQREGSPEFVFYDGPPFATGLPHYGHLLAGTIKDVVPRYQTMRGKRVDRVFGWDCHGLPVENEMEKELNLSSKKDIEDYGIARFNEACRGIVLRYTKEWEQVVHRMGRWVDFKRGYRTMDKDFMESIWWVFHQLWEKGLVYEGNKIQPYCPRCATPLSNFETNQGYVEVTDPAITVKFKCLDEADSYFLAWTTTPWTLPSNLALAVGPDIDYVQVKDGSELYILAEARVASYYKPEAMPEVVGRFKGSALAGRRYEPLFPYFAPLADQNAFQVILADYVSTSDGAGIVHTAPGFGEDDNAACKPHKIPEVCPIDKECRFTSEVADYQGRYVKDCDKDIIKRLKDEGKLVHRGQITHSYPHCWRCDSPLIYRAFPTWFVAVEKVKDAMVANNQLVSWVPSHIKDGRFGKWLENARDWNIGRNRYWGTPLPVWRNAEGEMVCVGSAAELERLSGAPVTDLHKHFVDLLEIPSPTGKSPLRRVPEVLDCWFESGSMPYAQQHYPFENKARFEAKFPADFIAEGLDQTRGWFYTLTVLAAALFDKPAFMNVVVNGLVLAEDGQKMSKRKKNYPDPAKMFDTYGADAMRLYLLGSPVVRGDDLRFSEDGIKETLRSVMLPLWNAYSFFVTYARVDNWTPPAVPAPPASPSNPLDRWILSSLCEMVEEIRGKMDAYQLQAAANRFEAFVEDLTNWYIRRGRRRFWKSQDDQDKAEAYQTLHFTLLTFVKTAAPFIPFVTEAIYGNLRGVDMPESVHLCDYPELPGALRDLPLERQMRDTIAAVSLGRFLRIQKELKTRQPLRKAVVVSRDPAIRAALLETADIIREELNVKQVEIKEGEEDLVHYGVKANFKALGPKLGKAMKEAAALIAAFGPLDIANILRGGSVSVALLSGETFEVAEDDIIISRAERDGLTVATEGEITVALETALTPELVEEGHAREFVSRVQNLRKELDFEVSDRIDVHYRAAAPLGSAIAAFADYIKTETLAAALRPDLPEAGNEACDINGLECRVKIAKI